MTQIAEKDLLAALEIARKTGRLVEAGKYLDSLGYLTFGVESVDINNYTYSARYINLGDTYDRTICFSKNVTEEYPDKYFIGDWGSWLEFNKQRLCKETNSIVCPYCDNFSPTEEENCNHCDHPIKE